MPQPNVNAVHRPLGHPMAVLRDRVTGAIERGENTPVVEAPAYPRAVVDRPDSVTHFVCVSGVTQTGMPDATHHIDIFGNCRYCQKSQHLLRQEVGL